MKHLLVVILLALTTTAFAATPDLAADFQGTSGCFILFDVTHNKLVEKYNPDRCKERITPASTFKVPLSLMAFDQKLISQLTVFKWDGKEKGRASWNQNQTPQSWLRNSSVWVSQTLTPRLGMATLQTYLSTFHYGNQDFSGNPGQHDGLTHAWLNSSLAISADEQLTFMTALMTNQLPVSHQALTDTKANMFLESMPKGYQLYGKTGTGEDPHALPIGWFIGFLQKAGQRYAIIVNFTQTQTATTDEPAGKRAQALAKILLQKEGLFS